MLAVFHHDGPFDACNPHRNRKGQKAAPMQAFPKDSRNMQIGGSGPLNSNIDLAQFHGLGEEGYNDYAKSGAREDSERSHRPGPGRTVYHPGAREYMHGEESMGLGTSTFLEGAPASRTAMQRRESDNNDSMGANGAGGLSRKKSLAMKIRGISSARPRTAGRISPPGSSGRMTSPTTPLPHQGTQSAHETGSSNPFFNNYDATPQDQRAGVTLTDNPMPARPAAPVPPTSPKKGLVLERQITAESTGEAPEPQKSSKSGGGLLSRVRSLKGGPRKAREKRDGSA